MTIRTFHPNKLAVGVALCLSLIAWTVEKSLAEQTPLRVAVVDAGDNPSAPPVLLDLIVVQLSQQQGLVLLERQQIDAVLQEQERNQELAKIEAPETFVTAGRILGADALVLISASPPNEQGLQPIEVRIVETRRGVRFGETVLVWSGDEQAVAEQLDSATTFIASRLGRVQTSKGKLTVVSLAGFRTDELSQEAHRFKRSIEAWLEAWLASQPGIAVAERINVLPLVDERRLASDLPAALGNADTAIDGTFKLDFSTQPPQVELTLRVLRKDGSLATRTLRASISEQGKLRESAGNAILELLALNPTAVLFDAKGEARLLTDEAERLLTVGRRYESLQRLTTAYALEPDDFRIQALLLHAGVQLGVGPDFSGAKFVGPFYPTALLLSDVARHVLDQIDEQRLPRGNENLDQRHELFARIGDFCSLMSQIQFIVPAPTESQSIQHEWLRTAVDDLFARYLSSVQTDGGTPYEHAIYTGLRTGRYWAKSPEEALNQRFELFQRAARLAQPQQLGIWAITTDHRFRLSDDKYWTQQRELVPLYEAYFQKMHNSDHPLIQAVGEREAAQFALWFIDDRTHAMVHYRRFIELVVNEVIPQYPVFSDHVNDLWLDLNYWSGKLALTDEEAGELWRRVILARWSPERRYPKASQPWEYRITITMQHLERAGQVDKAHALLQTCIDVLQTVPDGLDLNEVSDQGSGTSSRLQKLQQGLRERHPEFERMSDQIASLPVACQTLLQNKELPELLKAQDVPRHFWRFSGIVALDDGYAITCTAQEAQSKKFLTREGLAVVRLDKRGKPQSSTLFPQAMEYDYRSSRLVGNVGQFDRTFVSAKENLFVAVPMNGIVWFPPDGPPTHFSAKYLEQSDSNHLPVPFEEARQLTPINGKLYFTTGKDPFHPQIFELDYQRGETNLIVDSQSLANDSPLRGRFGFSICAGPPGELLMWARLDGNPGNGRFSRTPVGDLFQMNLLDISIKRARTPFLIAHPGATLSDQHHLCFQTPQGDLTRFNPATLSLELLIGDHSDFSLPSLPLSLHEFVYNEHYLLTTTKQPYRTSPRKWLLHTDGDLSPRQLLADNLPSPETVFHYLIDDEGKVFMLTSKALYRVDLPKVEDL